ncbi:unnamed protein product [Brassica oleracea var. botrytis]
MAKNINSVSITVLLFILLVASTSNFKKKILYRILYEAQTFCFE